jgi:predicted dehydrogenase
VALVDVREDKLAAARAMTGLGEDVCFHALEEALAAVPADAVVVITPPDFHARHCHTALQAGKHVLVEKPFTKDLGSAHALVRQAAAAGLQIQVCQNKRLGAAYQTLRRLLTAGTYGQPRYGLLTTFGWRPGVHHSGADRHAYLWERGIHDLDTLYFLAGRAPRRIWAHSLNPPVSPYAGGAAVQGWVEFEGGMSFGLLCTFAAHGSGSVLHLECDEAALELNGRGLMVHRAGTASPEQLPLDQVPPAEARLLDSFCQAVTAGVEPETSGARNLTTVGLVEGMGLAADQGTVLDFAAYLRMRTE